MFNFSEKSKIVLTSMGWSPQRKVDPTKCINNLQREGYVVFEEAQAIIEYLGGLTPQKFLTPTGKNHITLENKLKIYFAFYPNFDFNADDTPDSFSDRILYWKNLNFVKANHLEICPIGSILAINTLFVVSDGRIFIGQFYGPDINNDEPCLIFLGNKIDEAINKLTERCIGYL